MLGIESYPIEPRIRFSVHHAYTRFVARVFNGVRTRAAAGYGWASGSVTGVPGVLPEAWQLVAKRSIQP